MIYTPAFHRMLLTDTTIYRAGSLQLDYEIVYHWKKKVCVNLVLNANPVGWHAVRPIIDSLRYNSYTCTNMYKIPGTQVSYLRSAPGLIT